MLDEKIDIVGELEKIAEFFMNYGKGLLEKHSKLRHKSLNLLKYFKDYCVMRMGIQEKSAEDKEKM